MQRIRSLWRTVAVIKTNVLLESACAAGPMKQLTVFFALHQQLCLLRPLENPTEAPGSQEERCGWNQGKSLAGRSHQTVKLGESLKVLLGFCNKYCSDFSKNFFSWVTGTRARSHCVRGEWERKAPRKQLAKKFLVSMWRRGRGQGSENGGRVVAMVEEKEMNLGAFKSNIQVFFFVAFSTFYSLKISQNQFLAELTVWVTL